MKFGLQLGSKEFSFSIRKSGAAALDAWRNGDDVDTSGANLLSPFEQSTWVYGCIGTIANQLAQIPLRISRGSRTPMRARSFKWRQRATGEDLIASGPLVELLNRPHPQMTRFDFWYLLVTWLMLRGDTFAVPTTNNLQVVPLDAPGRGGKLIKRLAIIAPDMVREIVESNSLVAWSYTGSYRQPLPANTLLPEEVIFSKLPNPYDFWRGMAPLKVARLAASTDFASAQFMKGLIMNNADIGTILRTETQPDDNQREQMLAAWRQSRRRAGTANRPVILWGGMDIKKPELSAVDMQFLEQRKFSRQEVCAIFRVPQEILGFTEDANRSVGDAARLNFIENTIAGLCELFEAGFEPLARAFDPNYYIWFDIDSLPIMQRARQTRFATAKDAMTSMGVPLNVVNDLFDLGLPGDLPHGNSVFLPFSLQEYGVTEPPSVPPTAPAQNSADPISRAMNLFDGLSASAIPTHVCAGHPEYEASIAGSVRNKKGKLSKFFFEQRGRVLAKLDTLKGITAKGLDDFFDMVGENAKLLAKMKPLLLADLEFGGAQLWKEIGLDNFELPPADAIKFLSKRENRIQDINASTWDELKSSLQDGLRAGETHDSLVDRVKQVYQDATGYRAEAIALTETNTATNSGRYGAMVLAKVSRKGWMTSHLENSRLSHLKNEALSDETNGIPIDEYWPNGLLHPGDPSGAAGEVINCKCVGTALLDDKSKNTGPLLTYEQFMDQKHKGQI